MFSLDHPPSSSTSSASPSSNKLIHDRQKEDEALSIPCSRHTDTIPFLTGNPHTSQQHAGTLLLYEPVDLFPVLHGDEEEEDGGVYGDGGTGFGELASYFGGGGEEGRKKVVENKVPLPEGRGRHLAMLSLPAHMIPGELLQFLSPFREDIRLVRILSYNPSSSSSIPASSSGKSTTSTTKLMMGNKKGGGITGTASNSRGNTNGFYPQQQAPTKYMVLMEMSSRKAADVFYRTHHGHPPKEAADAFYHAHHSHPFNSLEPTRCILAYLKSWSFDDDEEQQGGGRGGGAGADGVTSTATTRSPMALPGLPSSEGGGGGSVKKDNEAAAAAAEGGKGGGGEGRTGAGSTSSVPPPSPHATMLTDIQMSHPELPQCVVCLEPLGLSTNSNSNTITITNNDSSTTPSMVATSAISPSSSSPPSIKKPFRAPPPSSATNDATAGSAYQVLITACNHAFHMDCLRKLAGPLCPVCRYNHDTVAYHSSVCSECGRSTDLWVCLVCGTIGCGRYHAQHSRKHYLETLHAYAIEVQTQQVWDYVGDGYVHRLLYHKGEGGEGGTSAKLVEVADPHTDSDQRPRTAPLSDGEEEEMIHRKLESWAQQYTVLLSSALEDQRLHFEQRLLELRASYPPNVSMTGDQVVAALRQEKRQLEQRTLVAGERLKKVTEEVGFLHELNQSLDKNKDQLIQQIREADGEHKARELERQERIPLLEQRVRELMMQLDLAAAANAEEGDHGGAAIGGGRGEERGGCSTPRKESGVAGGTGTGGSSTGVEESKDTLSTSSASIASADAKLSICSSTAIDGEAAGKGDDLTPTTTGSSSGKGKKKGKKGKG